MSKPLDGGHSVNGKDEVKTTVLYYKTEINVELVYRFSSMNLVNTKPCNFHRQT